MLNIQNSYYQLKKKGMSGGRGPGEGTKFPTTFNPDSRLLSFNLIGMLMILM